MAGKATRYAVTGRIDLKHDGRLYRAGEAIELEGAVAGVAVERLLEEGTIKETQEPLEAPEREQGRGLEEEARREARCRYGC